MFVFLHLNTDGKVVLVLRTNASTAVVSRELYQIVNSVTQTPVVFLPEAAIGTVQVSNILTWMSRNIPYNKTRSAHFRRPELNHLT